MSAPTVVDGASLITAERRRQVDDEGYSTEHDAAHGWSQLHNAGGALAHGEKAYWPAGWEWKPKNKLRDLIRAGALMQAAADIPGIDPFLRMRSESARDNVAHMIDELLAEARAVLDPAGGVATVAEVTVASSAAAIRVTATDVELGDSQTIEIEDTYVLVTAGRCELTSTTAHANGTHLLTVKNAGGGSKRVVQ